LAAKSETTCSVQYDRILAGMCLLLVVLMPTQKVIKANATPADIVLAVAFFYLAARIVLWRLTGNKDRPCLILPPTAIWIFLFVVGFSCLRLPGFLDHIMADAGSEYQAPLKIVVAKEILQTVELFLIAPLVLLNGLRTRRLAICAAGAWAGVTCLVTLLGTPQTLKADADLRQAAVAEEAESVAAPPPEDVSASDEVEFWTEEELAALAEEDDDESKAVDDDGVEYWTDEELAALAEEDADEPEAVGDDGVEYWTDEELAALAAEDDDESEAVDDDGVEYWTDEELAALDGDDDGPVEEDAEPAPQPDEEDEEEENVGAARVKALFGSRLIYGAFLAMSLPLVWALALGMMTIGRAGGNQLLLSGGLSAAIFLGLYTMPAFGAFWGAALGLAVAALALPGPKALRVSRLLATIGMVAACAFVAPLSQEFGTSSVALVTEEFGDVGISRKYSEWQAVHGLMMAREVDGDNQECSGGNAVVGLGPGLYQDKTPQYGDFLQVRKVERDSQNQYLVFGSTLGITGILAFGLLMSAGIRSAWRCRSSEGTDSMLRVVAAGMIGSLAALALVSLYANVIVRGTGVTVMLALCLAFIAERLSRE